jgi:hypothetical protein
VLDDRLIQRRKGRASRIAFFVDESNVLDIAELADEYQGLRATAPRRTSPYLVPGRNSRAAISETRSEERLAARLVISGRDLVFPDGIVMKSIDFQVPLKAVRADASVGKIDLVGVTDRVIVCELKIGRPSGGGDTPLGALLGALSYAAIVEANYQRIKGECRYWELKPTHDRPGLLILGNASYWSYWDYTSAARGWREALKGVINRIHSSIGLATWVGAVPDEWEASDPGSIQLLDPLAAPPSP